MRITLSLPNDVHEKVAVDALRKPRNSKEAVITEILRAHYGIHSAESKALALSWHLAPGSAKRIRALRCRMKDQWK